MMNYNTDINIIGSIPDYHMIYKVLPLIYTQEESLYKRVVTDNEFNFRTEKSRKRFLSALHSAFVNKDTSINELVGELLTENVLDDKSKSILLFWLFSIKNRLFFELNRDVFFKYYYQGRAELPANDVEAYLKDLIGRNSELKGKWSDTTIKTIASKYLTTLKKLNLLEGSYKKSFCFISMNDELLACFIHIVSLYEGRKNDFLEDELLPFSFISQESILERLKKLGKKDWIKMNYTGTSLYVEGVFNTKTIVNGIFRRAHS